MCTMKHCYFPNQRGRSKRPRNFGETGSSFRSLRRSGLALPRGDHRREVPEAEDGYRSHRETKSAG